MTFTGLFLFLKIQVYVVGSCADIEGQAQGFLQSFLKHSTWPKTQSKVGNKLVVSDMKPSKKLMR